MRLFILFLFLLTLNTSKASGLEEMDSGLGFGVTLAQTDFSINQSINLVEENVRFFTGKRQATNYLGFYMNGQAFRPFSKHFGLSSKISLEWWQAGYILNWDMPENGLSLEPIESTIRAMYFDLAFGVYTQWGPLRIIPLIRVPIGVSNLSITIEGNEETGASFYSGLSGNLEAQIVFFDVFSLNCGYLTTLIFSSTSKYEVEEGVKLEGEFNSMPEVLYLGISIYNNKQ